MMQSLHKAIDANGISPIEKPDKALATIGYNASIGYAFYKPNRYGNFYTIQPAFLLLHSPRDGEAYFVAKSLDLDKFFNMVKAIIGEMLYNQLNCRAILDEVHEQIADAFSKYESQEQTDG